MFHFPYRSCARFLSDDNLHSHCASGVFCIFWSTYTVVCQSPSCLSDCFLVCTKITDVSVGTGLERFCRCFCLFLYLPPVHYSSLLKLWWMRGGGAFYLCSSLSVSSFCLSLNVYATAWMQVIWCMCVMFWRELIDDFWLFYGPSLNTSLKIWKDQSFLVWFSWEVLVGG